MSYSVLDYSGTRIYFVTAAGDGSSGTPFVGAASPTPSTLGGLLVYRTLSLLATTGQNVKNAAGQLYGWSIANQNLTTARYFKIYNKASAPSSSDTPIMTIVLPIGVASQTVIFPYGITFALGIGIRATNALADNDNTDPTANDVVADVYYF